MISSTGTMDYLQRVMDNLRVFTRSSSDHEEASEEASEEEKEKPAQLLDEVTFEGIANYIKNGRCEYRSEEHVCWKLIFNEL